MILTGIVTCKKILNVTTELYESFFLDGQIFLYLPTAQNQIEICAISPYLLQTQLFCYYVIHLSISKLVESRTLSSIVP